MKRFWWVLLVLLIAAVHLFAATKHKEHVVLLGTPHHVAYSPAGDPSGALPDEKTLKIRPLLVDDQVKEWTTGEAHDVTDRSFAVRRAIRLNDSLPGENSPKNSAAAASRWAWQRGPWLLVDRKSAHISALHLPDYDPGVSQVSWFRDYGAYCGVTASGKNLYAVVAQVAVRKPALAKKLSAFDLANHVDPACEPPDWQRDPLRITFHPSGKQPVSLNFVPGSVVLMEEAGEEPETPGPEVSPKKESPL